MFGFALKLMPDDMVWKRRAKAKKRAENRRAKAKHKEGDLILKRCLKAFDKGDSCLWIYRKDLPYGVTEEYIQNLGPMYHIAKSVTVDQRNVKGKAIAWFVTFHQESKNFAFTSQI